MAQEIIYYPSDGEGMNELIGRLRRISPENNRSRARSSSQVSHRLQGTQSNSFQAINLKPTARRVSANDNPPIKLTQSTPSSTQVSPIESPSTSPPSTRKSVKKTMTKWKMKLTSGSHSKYPIHRSKSDMIVSKDDFSLDRVYSISSPSFMDERFQFSESPTLLSDFESESDSNLSEIEQEKPAYLSESKEKYVYFAQLFDYHQNSSKKLFSKLEWNSYTFWVNHVLKSKLDPSETSSLPPSLRMLIFLHFFRIEIPISLINSKNIKSVNDWKAEKRFPAKFATYIQIPLNSFKSYDWWCDVSVPPPVDFVDPSDLSFICHNFQTISGIEEQKLDLTKLRKEFRNNVTNNDAISSILSSPPNVQSVYIKLLIKWSTSTKKSGSPEVKFAACKALAFLTYPVEIIAGLRKKLLRSGALISILTFAKKGKINISHDVNIDDIQFGDLIGKGAVGKVYKGTWKNETVAIKVCKKENVAFIREEFCFEVALMSAIQHPRILPCLAAKLDPSAKFYVLISPLNAKGCLYDIIRNESEEISDYKKIWIAYCIADAVKYLHKNHIIHRDIKSSNVLIGENWESVNLTDFGTSRFFLKYDPTPLEGFVGTNEWMAPEMLENDNLDYSHKVDVYSFAMLLFEIITRSLPFQGMKSWQICDLVKAGARPIPSHSFSQLPYLNAGEFTAVDPFAHFGPKELIGLMKDCWHPSPRRRPNFSYIKNRLAMMLKKFRKNSASSLSVSTGSLGLPSQYLFDHSTPHPLLYSTKVVRCKSDCEDVSSRLSGYFSAVERKSSLQKIPYARKFISKTPSIDEDDDDDTDNHFNHLDRIDEDDD